MDEPDAHVTGVDVPGVTVVRTDAEREDALAVRHEVFVEGQDVPPELERDEYDADSATTAFVAHADTGDGRVPVGAARLRPGDEGVGKVERVAVLDSHRGEGWGRRLMDAVERAAAERGFERLRLDSQVHAVEFYERLGYTVVDDETFLDAGIPHLSMAKELES